MTISCCLSLHYLLLIIATPYTYFHTTASTTVTHHPPPLVPHFPLPTFPASSLPVTFPAFTAPAATSTLATSSLLSSRGLLSEPSTYLAMHFPDLPPIPEKLISRITSRTYFDLSLLLPDQLQSAAFQAQSSANETNLVVLPSATWETQRRKKRQIPDIATWVQLFCTYTLILASKHPDSFPDLVSYQLLIVKQARKFRYPSWLYYDIEFRKNAAATRNPSWARVNPEIYALAFTNQGLPTSWCPACTVDNGTHTFDCPYFLLGDSTKLASNPVQPSTSKLPSFSGPPPKKPRQTVEHCILYNQHNGNCRFGISCKYPHKCAKCGSMGHPMISCPSRNILPLLRSPPVPK